MFLCKTNMYSIKRYVGSVAYFMPRQSDSSGGMQMKSRKPLSKGVSLRRLAQQSGIEKSVFL